MGSVALRPSQPGVATNQPKLVAADLKDFIEMMMIVLARRTTGYLAITNPKDTGFSSVNWIPSIGQPHVGTAGTRQEAVLGRLDAQTQAASLAALRHYTLDMGQIYIANNVHYIGSLDAGSSQQQPAGWVALAIERAVEQTVNIFGRRVQLDSI